MIEPIQLPWHKTTTAKIIGIVAVVAIVAGCVFYFKNKVVVPYSEPKNEPEPEPVKEAKLPFDGIGCGSIVSKVDRVFDYIKCNEQWYIISKDKSKVADWQPLDESAPIVNLLNSKHG
jgi:hypothetical protein